MTNNKVEIYLLPWLISLVLSASAITILALFFPLDKLWLPCLPIAAGSFIAAAGYNVYELIASHKKEVR